MRKEFFDRCAQDWQEPAKDKMEIIKKYIIPLLELKNGESVLDVCGGPGVLIPVLKEAGVKITECDYSSNMVEKAKKLYPGQASFFVGNIEELPFEDGGFDKIICHNSLPHIEDKNKAFKECARVLKSGGIFVVSHNGGKKEIDLHHRNCHEAVKNDMMPSNQDIMKFASYAGFGAVEILDEEKYFAVICGKQA